jgi:hypothetical protein
VNFAAIALGATKIREEGTKAFIYQAVINLADRAIPITILVNSGAKVSFVSQR